MEKKDILDFLNFRNKFSHLEWHELCKAIEFQEKKRAEQIVLSDSDVSEIIYRLENGISTKNLLSE